jgi:hypothetical protein
VKWQFNVEESSNLPVLGWICAVDISRAQVITICGQGVETGLDFVVEGVWDGEFPAAEFHHARHFFGSGVKYSDEKLFFVPSCALTDRIVAARKDKLFYVSNSLLLLLAATNSALDPHIDYSDACHAIISGVTRYDPAIPVTRTDDFLFSQFYHRPVELTKNGFQQQAPLPPVRFNDFDRYQHALNESLQLLTVNAASTARKNVINHFTTTSTGYDSTAVSALAKSHGTTKSFTTIGQNSLDGKILEDGRPIVRSLALEALALEPDIPDPWHEQIMLGTTPDGRETLYTNMFKEFSRQDETACLWTGYHGDKLWDRSTGGKYLSEDILRGDMSGFNLSEIRIEVGFLNLGVPFMFASSIRDLVSIANSEKMSSWQVGGEYDRPIPRRIAEERGVGRDLFGQKKSVIMEYYTYCRHPQLASEFRSFLSREQNFGWLKKSSYRLAESLDYFSEFFPILSRHGKQRVSTREWLRPGPANLPNTLYVWAANRSKDAYAERYEDALAKLHLSN